MKKSIAIIGEGETEWFYFESLRIARRYPFKLSPGFPLLNLQVCHIIITFAPQKVPVEAFVAPLTL